jgi:hypothetical protein
MSKKNFYLFLVGFSAAGYAWLGWNAFQLSAHTETPSLCMFRAITGIPCPSCGTTRSILLLMHGDVWGSFHVNPFGALLFVALLIIPAWIVIDCIRKNDSFWRRYIWTEQLLVRNRWISFSAIVILVLNWAWNIAKGL